MSWKDGGMRICWAWGCFAYCLSKQRTTHPFAGPVCRKTSLTTGLVFRRGPHSAIAHPIRLYSRSILYNIPLSKNYTTVVSALAQGGEVVYNLIIIIICCSCCCNAWPSSAPWCSFLLFPLPPGIIAVMMSDSISHSIRKTTRDI